LRKYNIYIFFVISIFFLLSSLKCTGKNPKSITIWHSFRPTDRDVFEKALREFAFCYSEWEFKELYYEPEVARTNFIISALGGSGPELFWEANDNICPFVELGVVQPLENFFHNSFLDSFLVEPLNANTWMNNHLYQIADREGNHLCLGYNKNLISSPPTTKSELMESGKKISKYVNGDVKPDRYVLVWNYIEPFFIVHFIVGYGGWIIDENGQPILNTDAASIDGCSQFSIFWRIVLPLGLKHFNPVWRCHRDYVLPELLMSV